jgi:hypothetical protein
MRSMDLLVRAAASKGIRKDTLQISVPYCDVGGIRSEHLVRVVFFSSLCRDLTPLLADG